MITLDQIGYGIAAFGSSRSLTTGEPPRGRRMDRGGGRPVALLSFLNARHQPSPKQATPCWQHHQPDQLVPADGLVEGRGYSRLITDGAVDEVAAPMPSPRAMTPCLSRG